VNVARQIVEKTKAAAAGAGADLIARLALIPFGTRSPATASWPIEC